MCEEHWENMKSHIRAMRRSSASKAEREASRLQAVEEYKKYNKCTDETYGVGSLRQTEIGNNIFSPVPNVAPFNPLEQLGGIRRRRLTKKASRKMRKSRKNRRNLKK